MTPRRITLHVEELVLHGFAPGDRFAIAAAVESELARLLGERGMPPALQQPAQVEAIQADPIRLAPTARPPAVGAQVGQAVFAGLGNLQPAKPGTRGAK